MLAALHEIDAQLEQFIRANAEIGATNQYAVVLANDELLIRSWCLDASNEGC
jgi:hypothetical protein